MGTTKTNCTARLTVLLALLPMALPLRTLGQASGTTSDFTSKVSTSQAIHLPIGRTMTVNANRKLTRVYVTNPEVLDCYTASPTEVLVTAKKPGVSSLTIWDEAGQTQSYVLSADLDLADLRDTIARAMPHEVIDVHGSQGEIVLTGNVSTETAAESAVKLAGNLSKEIANGLIVNSAAIHQVKLKVRIIEIDRSKMTQFGFNLFSTGGKNLASSTTMQFPSSILSSNSNSGGSSNSSGVGDKTVTVSNPLNFLFYSAKLDIGATLQDLETKQVLQILAEPTITTLSGQKAAFLAGGEFPFPVVQGGAGTLASVTVQFRPYGVKLDFTPVVNGDGTIQLKVSPEVSALDYTNAVQISGYTIPAVSTRRAETQVVLKDGQSFAISGLLDKRSTDSFAHTPGIASIPILGALFRSKGINHSTTELMVVVTPEIVDPLADSDKAPTEPKPVIPLLDKQTFDQALPKAATERKK